MNTTRSILFAVVLTSSSPLHADEPIVTETKVSKRTWESAPVEIKARWKQQRDFLKHIDLSKDTQRQVIIARGTPEVYNAHPTTAMLANNQTMFCVWNIGHGGHAGPMARSDDGGQTWTRAVDTPWGLTGDRHHGVRLPDVRHVIVFRNASPDAKDKGLIAWVGTYDDIKKGKPGQYRISLLKTFKDGFYSGLHVLPDSTIVVTTYANDHKDDIGCSIISIRFKISEIDAIAEQTTKQPTQTGLQT